MARTCFANPPVAQMITKCTVSKKGDPAQSNEGELSKNKIAVNDFALVHQTTPTKATDSAYDSSDGRETWVTPFSSPQKELDTQPTKESIEASANLAKLIQQHTKTKGPQMATTFKEPTTSKPVEELGTAAPSSPAPRRAPTAQMVPLPPKAAITTTPAGAATTSETPTTSLFGPRPSPTNLSSPQAFFPATDSPSSPLAPIMSSLSTMTVTRRAAKKRTPKKTGITIVPAPATAPSAFKDAALAAHVQQTKLLSPAKNPTNGVKKRQFLRTCSPPTSPVSTPESVSEEKRGRGRPRTRPEEQPLQQHRPPVQTGTPFPRTCVSTSSLFAPSAFPLQQTQATAVNIKGNLKPEFCSEEPRLWPGCGDHVTSLLHFESKPEIHSEPIRACMNHEAHEDQHKPRGHGVCTTCRHANLRHIRATRPEVFGPAWWPLCNACGDHELLHTNFNQKGCSCGKTWLCFSCQVQEMESRNMKNRVEAEFRRRNFVGEGMDGGVSTVKLGFACECGGDVEPDSKLMKCVGCQGISAKKYDPRIAIAQETAFAKAALAWT